MKLSEAKQIVSLLHTNNKNYIIAYGKSTAREAANTVLNRVKTTQEEREQAQVIIRKLDY